MRTSASSWRAPPRSSILTSLFCATNPIARPSGDQNGNTAPSLPAMSCGSGPSNRRSHRCRVPSDDNATNTRRLPSGETAISAVPRWKVVPFGAAIENVTRRASADSRSIVAPPRVSAGPITAPPGECDDNGCGGRQPYPGASSSRALPATAVVIWWRLSSRTQVNSRSTSRARGQRSFGSFARHVATMRSSAGGASGRCVAIAAGSRSRIAATSAGSDVGIEGTSACQHLVEDRAKGEHIAARVRFFASRVARGPCKAACRAGVLLSSAARLRWRHARAVPQRAGRAAPDQSRAASRRPSSA